MLIEAQVNATFECMAAVLDSRNAGDPPYQPMAISDGVKVCNWLDSIAIGVILAETTDQINLKS
ncbi:hypothetical protein [Polaromonas sp. JS666]|uniref:hypothetical protein n=1 Tax=Polaromonas sp. (strain JS666 / ATCC BAA-500) TaxID=296591 RepID=UPI0003220578|nr:hypothetical protein [Polaromonas sp. JS666]UUZ72045.1 hypothetical protein LP415_26135 [Polaromonas sp. P1(28)-8]